MIIDITNSAIIMIGILIGVNLWGCIGYAVVYAIDDQMEHRRPIETLLMSLFFPVTVTASVLLQVGRWIQKL